MAAIARRVSVGLLVLVCWVPWCWGSFSALALTPTDLPNPRQTTGTWVVDQADILTPATETRLNQQIEQLEQDTSTEIAVVTVPGLEPEPSLQDLGKALFNHWGIGKAGLDNGILLLVSRSDRQVNITLGNGLVAVVSPSDLDGILAEAMLPRFRAKDFDAGVVAGTTALEKLVRERANVLATLTPVAPHPTLVFSVMVGLALIGGGGVLLIRQKVRHLAFSPTPLAIGKTQKRQERLSNIATLSPRVDTWWGEHQDLLISQWSRYQGWGWLTWGLLLLGVSYGMLVVLTWGIGPLVPTGWPLSEVALAGLLAIATLLLFRQGRVIQWLVAALTALVLPWLGMVLYLMPPRFLMADPIRMATLLPQPMKLVMYAVMVTLFGISLGFSAHLLHLRQEGKRQKEQQRLFQCDRCGHRLDQLPDNTCQELLDPISRTAAAIGSYKVVGWHCPHCDPGITTAGINFQIAEVTSRYFPCPNCQAPVVEVRDGELLREEVSPVNGLDVVVKKQIHQCLCCDYHKTSTISVPGSSSRLSSLGQQSSSNPFRQQRRDSDIFIDPLPDTGSSGSEFGGGSSGGEGATGDW